MSASTAPAASSSTPTGPAAEGRPLQPLTTCNVPRALKSGGFVPGGGRLRPNLLAVAAALRDLGSGLYPHAVPVGAHREPLGGVTWAVRADSRNWEATDAPSGRDLDRCPLPRLSLVRRCTRRLDPTSQRSVSQAHLDLLTSFGGRAEAPGRRSSTATEVAWVPRAEASTLLSVELSEGFSAIVRAAAARVRSLRSGLRVRKVGSRCRSIFCSDASRGFRHLPCLDPK